MEIKTFMFVVFVTLLVRGHLNFSHSTFYCLFKSISSPLLSLLIFAPHSINSKVAGEIMYIISYRSKFLSRAAKTF